MITDLIFIYLAIGAALGLVFFVIPLTDADAKRWQAPEWLFRPMLFCFVLVAWLPAIAFNLLIGMERKQ